MNPLKGQATGRLWYVLLLCALRRRVAEGLPDGEVLE